MPGPNYNQPNDRPMEPGDNASYPLDPPARGAVFQRMEGKVNVTATGEQTTVKPVSTPSRDSTPSVSQE